MGKREISESEEQKCGFCHVAGLNSRSKFFNVSGPGLTLWEMRITHLSSNSEPEHWQVLSEVPASTYGGVDLITWTFSSIKQPS